MGCNRDYLNTLRTLDEKLHRDAQQERRLEDPNCEVAPYHGSLFFHRARVLVNGQGRVVVLSIAARYIHAMLCDSSSQLLQQHIPYRYVPGRHHGKIEGRFRRWDMRIAAHGHESLVEELQTRIRGYERQRLAELLTEWNSARKTCAYFLQGCRRSERPTHIILSDICALEQIRLGSVMDDCRSIEQCARVLEDHVERERLLLSRFIKAQHAEALQEERSNVVKMPERYRILTAL